jgi:hypothetical protein
VAGNGRHGADDRIALALACGATAETAARSAQVSERTVQRRLADPAFMARVDQLRAELRGRAVRQLAAGMAGAAEALNYLTRHASAESVRHSAARSVFELSYKFEEAEGLARRVEALERRLAEVTGDAGQPEDPDDPPGGAGPLAPPERQPDPGPAEGGPQRGHDPGGDGAGPVAGAGFGYHGPLIDDGIPPLDLGG